jgi:hypothetical protein
MDNKLFRIKEDGMLLVKGFGFLVQMGKLKLEMRKYEKEKQQILRTIGMTTLDIYRKERTMNGDTVLAAVQHDLADLDDVDRQLSAYEESMAQLRSQFRAGMPNQGAPK